MLATDKEIIRQLKEEKQFKETLLGISEAVAQIQDRKELLKTILDGVKPIFGFYDVGLFVFDGKGNISDWATVMPEISESEVNRKIHQSGIEKVSFRDSALEAIYKQVNERPIIFPYSEEFFKRFPDDYQWDTLKELGYQESLFSKLTTGGKTLGMLSFNSTEPGFFQESQFPLFQAIADQLAVAVSNVLANEALIEEKQLTEKLLGISEALVNVSQRDQLFHIITEKIGRLLPMDDLAIVILNEDKTQWKDISIERELSPEKIHGQLVTAGFDGWLDTNSLVEKLISTTEIMTIDDYRAYKDFPVAFLNILEQDGLLEYMHTPLRIANEPFGFLVFDSKTTGTYSEKDFPLFQAIAHQLAVAVSNVLANEQLIDEKQLTEKLLGISEALVNVSQRDQLFHIITEKIGQLLPMDDLAIVIVNEDKTQWKDISIERDIAINQDFKGGEFEEWQPMNSLVEYQLSTTEVMTVENYRRFKDFPSEFLAIMEEEGLKEFIHTPLRMANEPFGYLVFDSKATGTYSEKDFPLFQAIADQLAVAVSNVLANEQLLEEKQFKETLLEISEAATHIRDRKQLYQTIMDKIHPIVHFDDAVVITFSEDLTLHNHLLTASPKRRTKHPYYSDIVDRFIEVENTPVDDMVKGGPFQLYNTKSLLAKYPENKGFLLMRDTDLNHSVVLQMFNGSQFFGLLLFHFSKEQLRDATSKEMYVNIGNEISVALSNVLANEALITEKKKTEDLLAVTESIANITTGPELVKAIFDKLQKVFPFDDAGLFHIDMKQQRERDLIVDFGYDTSSEINRNHRKNGLVGWMPLSPGVRYQSELGIATMGAEIYELFDHPHFEDEENRIFKQIISGPLRQGENTVGVLCFWSKKENAFQGQESLFESITKQMAVAFSNIIANEELVKREMQKTLELQLLQKLNQGNTIAEAMETLVMLLGNHFETSLVHLRLDIEQNGNHNIIFERIGSTEYRHWDMAAFLKHTGMTQTQLAALSERSENTALLTGNAFEKATKKQSPLQKTARAFNIKSRCLLPLQLGRSGNHTLHLLSKSENAYTLGEVERLESLLPTLALGLDKLLAYEQIERLNRKLRLEKEYLAEEVEKTFNFGNIIGESAAMQKVYQQISHIAPLDTSVFIQGETGTGKELVARAIHKNSSRKNNILVKVNCAAIPKELVESELFGHEKGAFTGALKDRIGKFELAHKGTIFLDEVGELPLDLQAKLLRVLQEKEIERLGSNETRSIDFRVITATNRDLQEAVAQGKFRADLYYRIVIYPIVLPPLRQREGDVVTIAQHFASTKAKAQGLNFNGFTQAAKERMQVYEWPGNVRELENVVQQELVKNREEPLNLLSIASVPLLNKTMNTKRQKELDSLFDLPKDFTLNDIDDKKLELERQLLLDVLEKTKWRVSGRHGAAALLDVKAVTLEYRMRKLGLSRK